ncbi:MAG: sulfite exporter TauE/SafE family protein [Acidobacteria bacterium]|nr:sulfite exporter TauE/SafE family protein [Acidobacteriota bacterium]
MLTAKTALWVLLWVFFIPYLAIWIRDAGAKRRKLAEQGEPIAPGLIHYAIAFVANFFDTLGIGSFATTTAAVRWWRLVPDRIIPGTLNVGYTAPTLAQALIFIAIIEADMTTLWSMIAASVLGAWLGAGIVSGWSRRYVQVGMGLALLAAASLMTMTQLNLVPGGGDAIGVSGIRLVLGIAGNFVLGALMTLGIGLYAPCMILVSLLGMNPTVAFPIMMGSCAFLMPVGSTRFVRAGSYHLRSAIAFAVAGVPAVLLAAPIVGRLSLYAIRWLVVVVVVYTATTMLRSAMAEAAVAPGSTAEPAV